jgi:hypothetical protein
MSVLSFGTCFHSRSASAGSRRPPGDGVDVPKIRWYRDCPSVKRLRRPEIDGYRLISSFADGACVQSNAFFFSA